MALFNLKKFINLTKENQMFTWSSAIQNSILSGFMVATIGLQLGMAEFWILLGISIAGSLSSVGWRWMAGYLKDWKQRCMAFFTGTFVAIVAIPYLESRVGLVGLETGIFVLGISLAGARFTKFMSTDFDIKVFFDKYIFRKR